jgi:hypothetical protein
MLFALPRGSGVLLGFGDDETSGGFGSDQAMYSASLCYVSEMV